MHFLPHIIEPKRLLIVWQTLQEQIGTGKRYIVGELTCQPNDRVLLRYFQNTQDFKDAGELGFKGYSIFDKNQETHEQNVMATLERRIPSRERTDFDEFLQYHRIDPTIGSRMTKFALLGYTAAKLPGDGFSFVHTFEEAVPPCDLTIEVAGVRHHNKDFDQLQSLVGQPVTFRSEPTNSSDPEAVVIEMQGRVLGYVNRAQRETFHRWIQHNQLEATIERVNGTPDRPTILLYVKVS